MSKSIPSISTERDATVRATPTRAAKIFTRARLAEMVAAALCLLGALAITLPHSPANMPYVWPDGGVFLYVGQRLLEGQALYRDVWDHKPPLIYYVNAFGLGATHGSRWGVWFVEYLAVAVASGLSYLLLRRAFGRGIALLVTAMWLLTFFSIIEDGNLTETYALPLQFGCLLLAYNIETHCAGAARRRSFVLGVLLGVLFFFKTNAIGVGLAIGAYVLLQAYPTRAWRKAFFKLVTMFGGFILVVAFFLTLFFLQGNLPDFWQAVFVFNIAYSGRFEFFASRFEALAAGYEYLALTGLAVFGVLGFVIGANALAFARARIPPPLRSLLGLAALCFPIEIILVTTSGRPFDHYSVTLLYVFAVWTAWLFYLLRRVIYELIAPASRRAQFALAASLTLAFVLTLLPAAKKNIEWAQELHALEPPAVVSFIRENTTPNDTVLVLRHEPRILFFAGRRAPTRFVHQGAFVITSFLTPALVEEFFGAVVKGKPKYIIDPAGYGLNNFTPVNSKRIRRLVAKMRRAYKPYGKIAGWMVYERVASRSGRSICSWRCAE
ncbi:MAG: glycosyltransferase family 39 protein [Chloroflexi bacterium]|nr:glycosyltransferase family 39 protein [Chloroflexota bacterium]